MLIVSVSIFTLFVYKKSVDKHLHAPEALVCPHHEISAAHAVA